MTNAKAIGVELPPLEVVGNNEEVWLSDDCFGVFGAEGHLTQSEAAEVIRCVNAHAALVSMLVKVRDDYKARGWLPGSPLLDEVEAALTLAGAL